MNNRWILPALLCVLLFSFMGCSDSYVDVRIHTPRGETVNFNNYDQILYADVEIKDPPKDYDPKSSIDVFFLEDVPRIINKDVKLCKDVKGIDKSKNTLLITGKIGFDVKIRSKIGEKGKGKKKKKGFIKVHHWHLTMEVVMTEPATGKEIFKKKYNDKLMDAEINDSKFNFETLFFRLNERFSRQITTIKKMKRRYLLTK